eukprot:scaffold159319_cov17-Tisochrysis_lutea.AAC.1
MQIVPQKQRLPGAIRAMMWCCMEHTTCGLGRRQLQGEASRAMHFSLPCCTGLYDTCCLPCSKHGRHLGLALAIKEVSAAVGEKISVRRFVKYQLGEGIEKKTSNLAEEVASIAGGSS